ncbi:hypothetical protein RJ640_024700 [Escallonia rubra]|uniref:Uncharacterized protein n=1 Tax=Escallonia rubra TaxID=112253 RepID=A0AA88R4E1_9ASTE|nr:hypothetical protein RJ640_024700 [Escallonia rubra]
MANTSGLLLLSMPQNNFTGPIPTNLGNLHDLEFLRLNGNQFRSSKLNDLNIIGSLTNCSVLPGSIANMSSKLETLWLGSNKISRSIPQEIGNLNNLYVLAIDHNMISGSIPESIEKLSKLQKLQIVINNISGKFHHPLATLPG